MAATNRQRASWVAIAVACVGGFEGLRLAAYAGALAVLLAVFAAYTRPDFLVTLADQLWSCF